MNNLIRMDLYRMRKSKGFWICLVLALAFALLMTPLVWALASLGRMFSEEMTPFPATALLTDIIKEPFPMFNAMLALLAANAFFFADIENGYIKNIAGQMPKRGFTILSKFIAAVPLNLLFMTAGLVGNLIGTAVFQQIDPSGDILQSVLVFLVKFLLIQSLCVILLLVTASCRSKSLGTVLSVLFGCGLLSLVYSGISSGLNSLLNLNNFQLGNYMPDQLLSTLDPSLATSLIVAIVTNAVFLLLAIRVFDRRDVK